MALFLFTRKILAGEPIDVFNYGRHRRDFTYVDDIVEGVLRVLDQPAAPNPDWSGDAPDSATSRSPYRLYNIGNNNWVMLERYIELIEQYLGRKAQKNLLAAPARRHRKHLRGHRCSRGGLGLSPNYTGGRGDRTLRRLVLEVLRKA